MNCSLAVAVIHEILYTTQELLHRQFLLQLTLKMCSNSTAALKMFYSSDVLRQLNVNFFMKQRVGGTPCTDVICA